MWQKNFDSPLIVCYTKTNSYFFFLWWTVNPKRAIFGVFEASIGNTYALNASAARDLCEHLDLTIASKAQVTEAQKHGLETCRWKQRIMLNQPIILNCKWKKIINSFLCKSQVRVGRWANSCSSPSSGQMELWQWQCGGCRVAYRPQQSVWCLLL